MGLTTGDQPSTATRRAPAPATARPDDAATAPAPGAARRGRPPLPHVPALDGLRGLAVLAVLLFHGGVSWAGGGFLGVSLFFTLSGFLITTLLLRERDATGDIAFAAFWGRRFRRLLPAALAAVVLALLVAARTGTAAQQAGLRGDALATIGYVANWRFVLAGQSYSALFAAPSPLLHFWSLAIEEQFYLVFPLVVWAALKLTRGSHRALAVLFGVGFAASAALPHLTAFGDDRVYYGTDTRAAELLAGALVAVAVARRPFDDPVPTTAGRRVAGAVGWLAVLGLVACWVFTDQATRWVYQGGLPIYAAVSAAAVLGALVPRAPAVPLLAWRPLAGLGLISYGVYLYHWPIFLGLAQATTWPTPVRLAVGTAATLALALLSFRYLEQPVRRRTGWAARLRFAVAAPAAAVVVAGAVLLATAGYPADAGLRTDLAEGSLVKDTSGLDRLGDDTRPVVPVGPTAAAVTTSVPPTTAVPLAGDQASGPPLSPKPVQRPSRPLRVVVVGDSTAMYLGAGLNRWGESTGIWGAANFARIGCGIGRGGERVNHATPQAVPADCLGWDVEFPEMLKLLKPDIVVVSSGLWDATDRRLPGDATWRAPGDPVYDDYLRAEWGGAADVLASTGAAVVWIDNPPIKLGLTEVPSHVDQYPVNDPARMVRLNQVLADVASTRPRMRVAPYTAFLAGWPGGPFDKDLRPDGLHVDVHGADVVSAWLGPEILADYWDIQRTRR